MPIYLEIGGKQYSMDRMHNYAGYRRPATVGSAQNTSLGPSPVRVIPPIGSRSSEIGGDWRILHGMTRKQTPILYTLAFGGGVPGNFSYSRNVSPHYGRHQAQFMVHDAQHCDFVCSRTSCCYMNPSMASVCYMLQVQVTGHPHIKCAQLLSIP